MRVFSGPNFSVRTDIDRTGETVAIQYARPQWINGTEVAEVRVFKRAGAAFAHVTTLTPGTWRNDFFREHFGDTIALSGDGHTLVIGDHLDNGKGFGPRAAPLLSGTDATGGAYVYRLTDQWRLVNMVKPNSNLSPGSFVSSLLLSDTGKTLIVAAESESSAANGIDGNWANKDRLYSGALFMY